MWDGIPLLCVRFDERLGIFALRVGGDKFPSHDCYPSAFP